LSILALYFITFPITNLSKPYNSIKIIQIVPCINPEHTTSMWMSFQLQTRTWWLEHIFGWSECSVIVLTQKISSKNNKNYVDSLICGWSLSKTLFEEMLGSRAVCATPFSSLPHSLLTHEPCFLCRSHFGEACEESQTLINQFLINYCYFVQTSYFN